MKKFTVSFFGNRRMENPMEAVKQIEKAVTGLLKRKAFVVFLVGRSGEFDLLAASVIRGCRERYGVGNSVLVLILPYETAEYRKEREAFETYYDEIEVCAESAGAHFKRAYQMRNRIMVEQSDLVIVYAEHEEGGAWQMLRYAKEMRKDVLDLAADIRGEKRPEG